MYFLFGRPNSVTDLNQASQGNAGDLRPKIQIAVIDDEPFEYETLLRQHGFSLRHFEDIEDVKAIQAYDIVVCDIRGVGKKFQSRFEGAHLISEIRKHYPQKVIYACSGQQFDPSYNKYFSMCQAVLKKDIDSDEWIEHLDRAIELVTNPVEQWKQMRNYLLDQGVPTSHLMKLEDQFVNSVNNRDKKFPSAGILSGLPEEIKASIRDFAASALFKLIVG